MSAIGMLEKNLKFIKENGLADLKICDGSMAVLFSHEWEYIEKNDDDSKLFFHLYSDNRIYEDELGKAPEGLDIIRFETLDALKNYPADEGQFYEMDELEKKGEYALWEGGDRHSYEDYFDLRKVDLSTLVIVKDDGTVLKGT